MLPSMIHTFIWMVTIMLIICQLKGVLVTKAVDNNVFNYSSKFICALMVTSIIGFSLAHITTANQETYLNVKLIDFSVIDSILTKFKWIPYTCGVVGVILLIYLISIVGSNIDSFNDYRIMAITTKKIGYAAIIQRISGHINILGGFYLMLLGYKYGQTGIHIKTFFLYALLCSAINLSIGGRVWILTSTLPFLIGFIFSRKYASVDIETRKNDKIKILYIIIIFTSLFSVIGLLRGDIKNYNFLDKFLYLTDGSRMTNIVIKTFPEGSYDYELGLSSLAQGFIQSPMAQKFANIISNDIGLSVTVKSIMPYLYYDFGFWGGAIFWGVICFLLEYICITLKYKCSIISILMFCQLAGLLFQSPIGHIFAINTPAFEWLFIIYLLRKKLF